MGKKKRGKGKKKVGVLDLDQVKMDIPPMRFKYQDEEHTIDIMSLVNEFAGQMERLKENPTTLIPKFLRVIGCEDMPFEKAMALLEGLLVHLEGFVDLSKKETSDLPSSSTSTPD